MLNILRRSNSDGRKPSWLILRHGSDRAYMTGDDWEAEKHLSQPPGKDLSTDGLVFTSSTAGGSFCTSCKKHLVWLTCWCLEGSQAMGPLLSHWGLMPVDFIQAPFALQYHFPRKKRGPASGKSLRAQGWKTVKRLKCLLFLTHACL